MTLPEFEAVTPRLKALIEAVKAELDGISYVAGEMKHEPVASQALLRRCYNGQTALVAIDCWLDAVGEYLARAELAGR
jgi:hypothetical protein